MGTASDVIMGPAAIYTGTANAYPTSLVGYTVDGVVFEYSPEFEDIMVDEETVVIGRPIVKEGLKFTLNFAEGVIANLNLAMAGADDGVAQTIKLGGGVLNEISILIEGTAPYGATATGIRTIILPRVSPTGAVGIPYGKGKTNVIPVEFQALKPTTGNSCEVMDFWEKTIAGGAFAHVDLENCYRLAGQGDAADDLDDITGGSDGDIIVLRIKDAANPITAKHLADTVELTGAVDFIMTDLRDWLELVCEIGDTCWEEVSRFDASA